MNLFSNRATATSGPATDGLPVIPDESTDPPHVAVGLYVDIGGTIVIDTVKGETRRLCWSSISRSCRLACPACIRQAPRLRVSTPWC